MRPRLLAPLLALGLSGACYQRPDLDDSWYLDRLRVLAASAEPAEPQPGQEVSFDALIWSPEGDPELVIWFACLPEGSTDFGCTVDEETMSSLEGADPTQMSPEELAELLATLEEAGLIGVDPYLAPAWTAPADALDGLTETQQLEGVSAVITLQAIPADAESDADVEIAYKRMPISLATTPNNNPAMTGILANDELLADGAALTVSTGEQVTLAPGLAADAIEDYSYLGDDGVEETRTEEPYFTWYTSAGTLDDSATLCDESGPSADGSCADAPTTWVAPEEATEAVLYVVTRDRRGGMSWSGLTVTVQ